MFSGATLVPNVLILVSGVAVLLLITFLVALIIDRNPLPFPDRDYHVFSVTSRPALSALERLMQKFGHNPRFRIDSDQVDRTVFSNGTIINHPHPQISATLGKPGGALGFVVSAVISRVNGHPACSMTNFVLRSRGSSNSGSSSTGFDPATSK